MSIRTLKQFVRPRTQMVLIALFTVILSGCEMASRIDYANLFDRKAWNHTDKVIEKLALKQGDAVVDLGSGDGYFSVRLADEVGPNGKVYAVDIDEQVLNALEVTSKQAGLSQIETVLAAEHHPNLQENKVDMVFMMNAYHHIEHRVAYFQRIKPNLNPDARIVILDTKEGTPFFVIPHGVHAPQIHKEMKAAGYRHVESYDFLPFNNFEVFELN